ncbi:MAG: hypothetical protein WCZ10_10490 [Desulfobulbaceae bacterium]
MLFDRFAGYVEQHRPDLLRALERTHLFEFPYRAHEVIGPNSFTQDDLDLFVLPFPAVAIEDGATCTFLFDTEEKAVGLEGVKRHFVDVLSMYNTDKSQYARKIPELDNFPAPKNPQEQAFQFSFGTIYHMELPAVGAGPSTYRTMGEVERLVLVDGRGEILLDMLADEVAAINPLDAQSTFRSTIGNVVTAIEELMLTTQDHELFVVEKSPVKPRVPAKGRILRSKDRPRYIMLRPQAIREKLGLNYPKGQGGRAPHERRRHWRRLQSERFTKKRGERILVEAHWVGPTEGVIGKTRYQVRLDI